MKKICVVCRDESCLVRGVGESSEEVTLKRYRSKVIWSTEEEKCISSLWDNKEHGEFQELNKEQRGYSFVFQEECSTRLT